MDRKKRREWLKRTKRSTAKKYFEACKRGDIQAMKKYSHQDSLEQKRYW